MPEQYDTHNLSLTDLPHVLRLSGDSLVLDACLRYTTSGSASGNWLASMMPHTSYHTLVARCGGQRVVGQFYVLAGGSGAQIITLAPQLVAGGDDSAWLLVLDAMVREAGRRGAHTLMAEIDETDPAFTTLRQSGFAVYARQQLWAAPPETSAPVMDGLQPATAADALTVQLVYHRTVPSLLQRVMPPPEPKGFVYREGGEVLGFISVVEGRDGLYLVPYLDYHIDADPAHLLMGVLGLLPQVDRLPATVRVRRHQGWMNAALEDANFELIGRQALMVRHISAGVHSPGFASLRKRLSTGNLQRPIKKVPEVCIDAECTSQTQAMSSEQRTQVGSRGMCDGMARTSPQRHPVCPNGDVPR